MRALAMTVLVAGLALAAIPVMPAAAANAPAGTTIRPLKADVRELGEKVAQRAIAFLKSKQDEKSGGWSIPPKGPSFPAITGLVVNGMLLQPGVKTDDPAVSKGLDFILSKQQQDGGIYDQILASYNTAICLSALAKADNPKAKAAIPAAQEFLRKLQYGEGAVAFESHRESAEAVDKSHPFYGGVGYGRGERPDLSNLNWVLQGLHDSGVPGDDAAFQRALVFLQRTQMIEEFKGVKINDMDYAKGSSQGGFIYSTAENKASAGKGESKAPVIEETLDDGTKVSRLRAYGSMTYAGFKSYLYADLTHDDPRVLAALGWMKENYTLRENPGVGQEGYYYYLVTFSRALQAFGEPVLEVQEETGRMKRVDWREDLIKALAEMQQSDGSFKSVNNRWMENDPVLITAYGLIAVGEAMR